MPSNVGESDDVPAVLQKIADMVLIIGVILTPLLVYLLPRRAPQDLLWTPLDLEAPVGLATAGKITALDRPECRTLLDRADIAYRLLPATRHVGCAFDDGLTWSAGGRRKALYAPSTPPLACPLAAALAVWEREVVQRLAEKRLGARVVAIEHYELFVPPPL